MSLRYRYEPSGKLIKLFLFYFSQMSLRCRYEPSGIKKGQMSLRYRYEPSGIKKVFMLG
jgi:hypothetical protein